MTYLTSYICIKDFQEIKIFKSIINIGLVSLILGPPLKGHPPDKKCPFDETPTPRAYIECFLNEGLAEDV